MKNIKIVILTILVVYAGFACKTDPELDNIDPPTEMPEESENGLESQKNLTPEEQKELEKKVEELEKQIAELEKLAEKAKGLDAKVAELEQLKEKIDEIAEQLPDANLSQKKKTIDYSGHVNMDS